jgi:GT2 family glycosyltransferase
MVGDFDEDLLINEDTDWIMRARRKGISLWFCPTAVVTHRNQRHRFTQAVQHGYQWGYYSIVNRHRYSDLFGTPFFLKSPASVLLMSPLIASGVTAGIVARGIKKPRVIGSVPAVWLAKMAWCIGAARRLRETSRGPTVEVR